MKYLSTRGQAPQLEFEDVLLAGLARDGGLYLPETWPQFTADQTAALAGLSYAELAFEVVRPFVGGTVNDRALGDILQESYAAFDHPAVAPLKQLDSNLWLLELFHGPTLAFKDYPLQIVGRLFDHALKARGRKVTIVGATSGDTGSAAIEACRDRPQIEVFMLHPEGRVSEVQRRQMTSITSPNIHNIAVQGSFDDCQDLVKALFADETFRDEVSLSAVNSINWARVMVQIAYYFAAAVALGAPHRSVSFAVPTGNFGNIYAAYAAKQMGLPIEQLIIGSNRNDILTRFFESGVMQIETVEASLSPAMDIQVSSNFERLLFDLTGRDGARVDEIVKAFRDSGRLERAALSHQEALADFAAARLDDRETLAEVRALYAATGELIDPHTAIGVAAGRAQRQDPAVPLVAIGTAHPAKFPDAVQEATGIRPALPDRLADLYQREERYSVLPNDLAVLQDEIRRSRVLETV